jgi:wyosine [tRNA(Phe)-imidazoG37] synthetase (radical SAM superfamily)
VKHIFGPVPSRRLGLSLGIDLVPYKTCNLDCVYCEAGRTKKKTMVRYPFVTAETIIYELQAHLLNPNPLIDYFTLSGAGEPTLNSEIGTIIKAIKEEMKNIPLSLITNGTLFCDPYVREQVLGVDVIMPSLDAISHRAFHIVNRPCPTLDNEKIVEGLVELRKEYTGKIWVEVFVIPGITDEICELSLLKNTLLQIQPDKVHLNSLDRPSAEPWVKIESISKMEQIVSFLDPLPCEIMAKMIPSKKLAKLEREEHTREIQKHIEGFSSNTQGEAPTNPQKK